MLNQLYPATLACVSVFHMFLSRTYSWAGLSIVHVLMSFTSQHWLSGDNINCDSRMSSCQNHFLRSANTVVFYIKCLNKRKQKEKVPLSSQNGPYEVQKFINMIDFFFLRVFQGALF